MSVIAPLTPPRQVIYKDYERDADGDVVFLFMDPRDIVQALRRSSPVVSIRRVLSPVIDAQGLGTLGKYLIKTQNSEYQVQLERNEAKQLTEELAWK